MRAARPDFPSTNAFKVHDTTTAPAPSAEILKGVQKTWGFVPNLHRVLAESPAALEAYASGAGQAQGRLSADPIAMHGRASIAYPRSIAIASFT